MGSEKKESTHVLDITFKVVNQFIFVYENPSLPGKLSTWLMISLGFSSCGKLKNPFFFLFVRAASFPNWKITPGLRDQNMLAIPALKRSENFHF